jgi:hypothetical protein
MQLPKVTSIFLLQFRSTPRTKADVSIGHQSHRRIGMKKRGRSTDRCCELSEFFRQLEVQNIDVCLLTVYVAKVLKRLSHFRQNILATCFDSFGYKRIAQELFFGFQIL